MRQLIRWGAALTAILVLWGMAQASMLASLDSRIGDWRLEASSHLPTDSTVIVEIDSKSLGEIGVWPWPRTLYARILDRLMAAGVDEVAFDIDFSSASNGFDDALFTAALDQAGGYAWLAAFGQREADGSTRFSRPLPEFGQAAGAVLVNVLLDPMTGRAQSIPITAGDAEGTVPALAVQLGRPAGPLPTVLEIDFGIELSAIPRFSFADVLYGRVDSALLAGKQVIVGASAIELRDFFNVPRYGIISGPMLQALALETVKAGRILSNWGGFPGILVVTGLVVVLLVRRSALNITATAVGLLTVAGLGEAVALTAYRHAGLIVHTGSLHVGLGFLFGLALADNGYNHFLARQASQRRLLFLATHDAATGIWSRQGLLDQPDVDADLVLILLHVPTMDELRATLGPDIVEGLLLQFAHRLSHVGFGEIARTGPANFALVGPDDGNADRLVACVRQIRAMLSGRYMVRDHSLHIEVVAGYAAGSRSRATLLSQAEIALIQARSAKIAARGFNLTDQLTLDRHIRLDRDLRQAIEHRQLHLLFQPQVDLKTRRIIGAEALLRWNHPELGMVPPAEFIPLAEETGYIIDLGEWALWQACQQAILWPIPIIVAVTVSPVQFQRADIFDTVNSALRGSGLSPSRLELEITEAQSVTDPERVRDVLRQIQQLDVRLSIDDFGTGYSSLSYLRDLPFETVKIDQSFVRNRTSEVDQALLAAIVSLAAKMGKLTIAEGVEDEATAVRLANLGCSFGQGYHFSRPISSSDLSALLLVEDRCLSG